MPNAYLPPTIQSMGQKQPVLVVVAFDAYIVFEMFLINIGYKLGVAKYCLKFRHTLLARIEKPHCL